MVYMVSYLSFIKLVILYLISPASYFVNRYKIDGENMMLLRITINICYYTIIISIYFIVINI